MKEKYNLGIIGYGGMGKWHHLNMDSVPGVDMIAICDISEAAFERARGNGVERIYDNLDEFLNDKDIDIVTIATPNDLHNPFAIKAMAAGKHVISEKPVTMTEESLTEMIEASKKYNKVFSVHQNRRWDKDFLTIKHIYDNNTVGKIFSIHSRVMGSRGIPGDWRAKPEHGGGMILDWGVHLIDQALFMIDSPVKDVYVRMQHVRYDEVDDGFELILTFENGIVYTIEVCTSSYIPLPRWHVSGDEGSAVINDWSLDGKIVKIIKGKENEDATPIVAGAGLTKTMAPRTDRSTVEVAFPEIECDEWVEYYTNFVNVINEKEELLVKPEQAMRVIKVMQAAFESERTGEVIHLNV